MSTSRPTLLLALIPFLFAAKCRKPPVDDNATVVDPLPPEVTLQLTSIDPRRVEAGQGFRARIVGTGFQEGARVRVGATELNSVVFVNENSLVGSVGLLDPGGYDVRVTNPDGTSAILRAGIIVESQPPLLPPECRSFTVQFGLDATSLDSGAMRALSAKASCFEVPNINVQLDGHCDDRGTTDYNLSLGYRRAEGVKRHLVSQGVPPSRITLTSYGEEQPVASGNNESAWSQNRRVEITISE